MKRKAFTMIELIFVIVILGILAAVAVPKMGATRNDAKAVVIAKQTQDALFEIASRIVATGVIAANLTEMSNVLTIMVSSSEASSAGLSANIKAGDTNNCVTLSIISSGVDKNVTLSFNATGGDVICIQVQNIIDPQSFPIQVTGASVVY